MWIKTETQDLWLDMHSEVTEDFDLWRIYSWDWYEGVFLFSILELNEEASIFYSWIGGTSISYL